MEAVLTILGLLIGACALLFPTYLLALAWNIVFRRWAINPWTPVVVLGLFFILADLSLPMDPERGFGWAWRAAFLVPMLFVISRWRRYREPKGPPKEHQL